MSQYDAILLVAFGGPEGPDDVMPFLQNVTRGRDVPPERLLEVAGHYEQFHGVSPLNEQVRALQAALEENLARWGLAMPVYWGNRNWHPLLTDTLARMADDGVRHAVAIVLSAYSSYSSCRQYLENIEAARETTGASAPVVDKVRAFFNHPNFIAANTQRLMVALKEIGRGLRSPASVAFTAHSIPAGMAAGSDYAGQLNETARLVAEACGLTEDRWDVVYQSRSGRPEDAWLEPDILDHLRDLHDKGINAVVAHPIGFLSDHLEVLFDLDVEAAGLAEELGLTFRRAGTVGLHPSFVDMLGSLVKERVSGTAERISLGEMPACRDICPDDCCPLGRATGG